MTSEFIGVTIGIPFYNAESTLLDAVRSVFAQTWTDWELILVDDGSTDSSLELAKSIDDPRVFVYSDGKNKRLAARLNEIVRLARYPFVARMDADDLMTRDRIERQLRFLLQHENIDLVSAGPVSMSDNLKPSGVRLASEDYEITAWQVIAGQTAILHGAVLGRTAWFRRNPYDDSLPVSQDTNLWIRAYAKDDLHVKVLPEYMYFYREDGNVVYTKLALAYRVHRRTIWRAKSGYRVWDRIKAYMLASMKSIVSLLLYRFGRLDVLRSRRNIEPIDVELRMRIENEVAAIIATRLPRTDDTLRVSEKV